MNVFVFLLVVLVCFAISKWIVKNQKVSENGLKIGGESPEKIKIMHNTARQFMKKNAIVLMKEDYEIKTIVRQGKIVEVSVETKRNKVSLSEDGKKVVYQKVPSENGATILLTLFFSMTILVIYTFIKILI